MLRAKTARWLAASMALLMLWGASASAIASLGCALGVCQHGCPMAAAKSLPKPSAPAETDPHACCKTKAAPTNERSAMGAERAEMPGCSCQLGRAPEPARAVHPVLAIPPAPAVAELPQKLPEIPLPPLPRAQEVLAYADPSPPPVPWHPDFGRAPPTR